MLCAKLLRHKKPGTEGRFYRASERAFQAIIGFYGKTLEMVLRFRVITLLVAAGTLALTIYLYIIIPKGFFPVQDTGVIQAISEADQTISFDAMSKLQQKLSAVILLYPVVRYRSSFLC